MVETEDLDMDGFDIILDGDTKIINDTPNVVTIQLDGDNAFRLKDNHLGIGDDVSAINFVHGITFQVKLGDHGIGHVLAPDTNPQCLSRFFCHIYK